MSPQPWLVSVLVRIPLLRRAAQLVELTIRAPRLGIEARTCNRQHIAMAAAFRAILWRTPPAAGLELHDGRRLSGNLADGLGFCGGGRRCQERVRHLVSDLILK